MSVVNPKNNLLYLNAFKNGQAVTGQNFCFQINKYVTSTHVRHILKVQVFRNSPSAQLKWSTFLKPVGQAQVNVLLLGRHRWLQPPLLVPQRFLPPTGDTENCSSVCDDLCLKHFEVLHFFYYHLFLSTRDMVDLHVSICLSSLQLKQKCCVPISTFNYDILHIDFIAEI